MIHEYMAEVHVFPTDRKEIWTFKVPAKFAQVGEPMFIIYPLLGGQAAKEGELKYAKTRIIKAIQTDEEFHVRRFKLRWVGWTPWVEDYGYIFLDAENNPMYPRGARRHEDDDY